MSKVAGAQYKLSNAELFERYFKTRSKRDRDAIARANDRLALDIAHRYSRVCPVPLDDLAQIARIGLLKAIERYDRSHGAAFSSFAVPYIRGEIMHFLRDDAPDLVRPPRRWREDRAKVRAEHARWLAAGQKVTEEQVAGFMGISPQLWREIVHATSRQTIFELEEGLVAGEPIADLLADQDSMDQLKRSIALLPRNAREIVMQRYYENLSVAAIARKRKTSEEAIEQLLERAHQILRAKIAPEWEGDPQALRDRAC